MLCKITLLIYFCFLSLMILFLVHFRSTEMRFSSRMPVEKEKGDEKRAKRKERASVTDGSDHEPLENFLKQLEQLEEL